MKSAVRIVVSLAASFLLACGVGPESAADESVTSSSGAGDERGDVTAAAAVCGDGICALIERRSCPADCPWPICGDGVCCDGETQASCPTDCSLGDKPYCYKNPLLTSGPESSSAPEVSESTVSPMACVTLYRPRYSSWWSSFPIEVDGQMGGCETHDDCTTTCWGVETPYYIHQDFFYCTYCP